MSKDLFSLLQGSFISPKKHLSYLDKVGTLHLWDFNNWIISVRCWRKFLGLRSSIAVSWAGARTVSAHDLDIVPGGAAAPGLYLDGSAARHLHAQLPGGVPAELAVCRPAWRVRGERPGPPGRGLGRSRGGEGGSAVLELLGEGKFGASKEATAHLDVGWVGTAGITLKITFSHLYKTRN